MNSQKQEHDLVLESGALVKIKARRDAMGANVICELQVAFPTGREVPLGGITTQVLREIPLAFLLNELHAQTRALRLSENHENLLLNVLRNFPSSPGRVPIGAIYPASVAYFYEKYLSQKPYQPIVTLSDVLGVPARTMGTRVAKARSLGYLTSGATIRSGGRARGKLSATAKKIITEYLKELEDEY